MMFCVLLPFWISVLVRSFAWLTLLGGQGVVNGLLMDSGLIDEPLALVRNETGVLIGMVHVMLPYAILTLYANMLGIDTGWSPRRAAWGRATYKPSAWSSCRSRGLA